MFTVEAGLKAAEYGIDRLELCSDFGEGGETPSAGALAFLKEKVQIPVFVMIRPRGGDFVYSPEELYVMRKDIAILKSHGADGFVFGALDKNGHVDKEACKYLMHAVEDSPCTFHRAFDISRDKDKSIEDIFSCGFQRILTSGGENDVSKGISNILKWMGQVSDQIIIMPGGGLKPSHISELSKSRKLKEVHASCKAFRSTESKYSHPSVSLSNDPNAFKQVLTIDKALVNEFLTEIKVIQTS